MKIGIDARPLVQQKTGIQQYIYNILRELAKTDNVNEYYLYSHKDFELPFDNPKWHKRIGAGLFSLIGSLYIQTAAKKQISLDKPDVFWGTSFILPLGLKMKKVLTVYDFASYYFPATLKAYNLFIHKLLLKRSIGEADQITTISKSTAKDINRLFNVPDADISVITPAIGEEYLQYNKQDAACYIAKKYSASKKYILTVGTVEPRKNIEALLKAFRQLIDQRDISVQLLICGANGWKNSSIFKSYRDLGFNEKEVKFLGYVPQEDMARLYSGADVFVFPAIYEGFGMPPLEAMGCGSPVVASNTSSLPEVCGDAACYIDPNNISSITDGIYKVLTDQVLKKNMIEKGLERSKMFSWDKAANEVLKILNRAGEE